RTYNKLKNFIWRTLGKASKYGPNSQRIIQQIQNAVKTTIFKKSNLFEAFNFRYFGPVDGNDVVHLIKLLNDMKNIRGPKLLHCVTVKGKGFSSAEKEQTRFHSPGIFDKTTGKIFHAENNKPIPSKYQDVFGETIIELAEKNDKIVGITPAMATGCSLNKMMEVMPDRVFDVGIAEQHAVTFSAGLATQGLIPFCNIYSTFMQRGYDQLIHDVALQKLHVIFCLDRAGLVGEDGATHQGAFDLSYLHAIPNMIVSAPMNEQELRNLMFTAQLEDCGPFSIRYPRGRGVMIDWKTPFEKIEIGKGRVIKDGDDIAIISIGHPGNFVVDACKKLEDENLSIAHFDLRFLKPIDENMLHNIFKKFDKIITVEDGSIAGGMGSAVLEFMSDNNYNSKVKRLGIPDSFIEHGTPKQLYKECGFDSDSIADEIKKMMSAK
ncbi:MAG: 1-deoxy-D-xylulose-5-phosphate synthase, partial [Bacteroidetes bacterium]